MTETTRRQHGNGTRSPEYRLSQNALQGLRQDLFHDPFAYRLLPPRRTDGPFVRRLPGRLRQAAQHLPHAVVAAAALLALAVGAASGALPGGDTGALLTGVLCALPVVATLVRPIGAFWLSPPGYPHLTVKKRGGQDRPRVTGALVSHHGVGVGGARA
ncbi:two-component sensor histidine kinase, partial [Streptomyces olivaceus]